MTSVNLIGVHLLPSTGEFAYDIYPAVGAQRGPSGLDNLTVQNTFSNPSLAANVTDYTNSIDQLQAQHPECTTISVVVAWFFNSEDASTCQIYPSTNFVLGEFQQNTGSGFLPVRPSILVRVHTASLRTGLPWKPHYFRTTHALPPVIAPSHPSL